MVFVNSVDRIWKCGRLLVTGRSGWLLPWRQFTADNLGAFSTYRHLQAPTVRTIRESSATITDEIQAVPYSRLQNLHQYIQQPAQKTPNLMSCLGLAQDAVTPYDMPSDRACN